MIALLAPSKLLELLSQGTVRRFLFNGQCSGQKIFVFVGIYLEIVEFLRAAVSQELVAIAAYGIVAIRYPG